MRTKIITLITAAFCLTAISSCSKADIWEKGKADANGLIELSVKGVLGEYKAEETKASLVNNIRVGWEKDDTKKDTVLVFHKEEQKYLGYLVATVRNGDDRTATLSGTISAPEGDGNKTLVFVYGTGLNPSGFTAGQACESVTLDLSGQGEKTPFLVFGTAPYVAETISNVIVDFSFATSVVSTYAAGLPASTAVTKVTLSSVNTRCVLTIPASGDLAVSGSESGTITKDAGIGSTNADGQVLFEITVPASEAAASGRSIVFTAGSKIYTAAFSGSAITVGRAYSAMSENHSVEGVALNKTSTTILLGTTETLTATVYPDKSNKALTWASDTPAVATVDETGKVTGIAPGTATITATTTDGGKTATCTVTVEDLDYIEMKMGSDKSKTLKWKKMNLGATTVAGSGETCYGDYYAWGETRPYYVTRTWDNTNKKWTVNNWYPYKLDGYDWQTYCNGSNSFAEWNPTPYDNTTKKLNPEYDVVQQKVGNGWRMPTKEDFKDLYDACGGSYDKETYKSPQTCGETTLFKLGVYWCASYDGVAGCLFCDGTNKLFFPATGVGFKTNLNNAGSYGYYWSSSLSGTTTNAFYLNCGGENKVEPQKQSYRYYGGSVRPVSDL